MNAAQAADVLGPVMIGFTAARLRLQAMREEAGLLTGYPAARALADIDAADDLLRARLAQLQGAGLMTVLDTGAARVEWPNVYPSPDALAAAVDAWAERLPPEQRERLEAVATRDRGAVQVLRRLARKAAGQ